MASLATLRTQLDELETLRASGLAASQVDGTSLKYHSYDDLTKAINEIRDQIARLEGARPRRPRVVTVKLSGVL